MSDPLRVAAAVEGPTDAVVLRAVFEAVLSGVDFEFHTVQPEGSVAFGPTMSGTTGAGWVGIYRWSRQSVDEGGGSASDSSVFAHHDVLIVQVDADVATKTYASGSVTDAPRADLPCHRPFPPARDTTDALRAVVLNWLGETSCPSNLVLCTPSMSMEAWVVASLWPDDPLVMRPDWECRSDPGAQLAARPRHDRVRKNRAAYEERHQQITDGWPIVAASLPEAERFQRQLLTAVRRREY